MSLVVTNKSEDAYTPGRFSVRNARLCHYILPGFAQKVRTACWADRETYSKKENVQTSVPDRFINLVFSNHSLVHVAVFITLAHECVLRCREM